MEEISVTVSSKGQIAIPKAIRDQMGLAEGTRLSVSVQGQNLILRRPGLINWRSWHGRFKDSPIDKDLTRERRKELSRDQRRIRNA